MQYTTKDSGIHTSAYLITYNNCTRILLVQCSMPQPLQPNPTKDIHHLICIDLFYVTEGTNTTETPSVARVLLMELIQAQKVNPR